jgi:hypothetical protein
MLCILGSRVYYLGSRVPVVRSAATERLWSEESTDSGIEEHDMLLARQFRVMRINQGT